MAIQLSARGLKLAASAAVAAIAMAPQSAHAASWSKTDAILGGAPSALAAILAQQHAVPAAARYVPQPASYSTLAVTPAIVRTYSEPEPGVESGQPDVFGSVAMRVGNTRLDSKWRRVEHARLAGSAEQFAASLKDSDVEQRLAAVNHYVNARVHFEEDIDQYGRSDVWSAANDTLRRGRGDCEDYAIAKLQMLRAEGIADRNLYLVIVRDLITRADHATLVVRAAGHMYVLDNGTDRLLDSDEIRDYRPVLTFASTGTWTHGYRLQSAPVVMAQADVPPAASAPQRSWSASLLAFNAGLRR
jgi:predicted transglutaminase-like cysteine proteinase